MAHIVRLSVCHTHNATRLKWNRYHFREPQAHIDQMIKSNDDVNSDGISFILILFYKFLFHRYECVHISFFVYLRSAFVFSIHLTNSLTTNSWQWNIPKYCSHLLVFRWWNSYMQIWCLQAFTIYRWVYCDCDTAVRCAQKTISENHFWISQNTDQKITCIFQYTFSFIHSSQWFVILLYARQKKRETNLKWYAIFFFIWNFFLWLHVCVNISAIPRSKSLFSLNVYFVCICSEWVRERV